MENLALKDTLSSDLEEARRVLTEEAEALVKLSDSLGDEFIEAVDLLQNAKGRVVVCGIGKSGHVARKIAATLASTGTPAFFIHPSEASHGDLGMISEQDALIILSNSGETAELSDIIHFCKRFSIPFISISSRAESTLSRESSVSLVLPDCGEACPMGLAPTTSTTLMLALGDALAVSLLKRKDFKAPDFKLFHPGGRLGQQLKIVRDIMRRGDMLPLVSVDTVMSETIVTMTEKAVGCVGVIDKSGELLGIITDGDLRRHMSPELLDLKASQVMTKNPKITNENVLAAEAVAFMNNNGITNIFVLHQDTRQVVGLLNMHDCLKQGIQ